NYAQAVAVLPSGAVVAAGYAVRNGLGDVVLASYQNDGTLDSSFGAGGIVRTEITGPGANDAASSVFVQPDGKITSGGTTVTNDSSDFALTRYLPDGSLDPTFGIGGKVTSNFGDRDSIAGIALQTDGKIIAAGSMTPDGGSYRIVVARYLANGDLDPAFGVGGKVATTVGSSSSAGGVALQPDGKIVVVGTSGSDFAVVRYLPDGSLDPSFGTGGEVTTAFRIGPQPPPNPPTQVNGGAVATGLAIEANGTIIVSGTVSSRTLAGRSFAFTTDFALARYLSNGQLDPTFGSGGEVMSHIDESGATSLVVQGDGRIIAAGWNGVRGGYPTYSLVNTDFAMMRFLPDGSLDGSFGTGGQVTTHFGATDRVNAVVLQPDGRILAAGSGNGNVALARYLADGTLDTSFGDQGKVGDFSGYANALALQSDGKVIVAGASTADFILARYTLVNHTYFNGQPGDNTVATFVHNLYRETLGREPDQSGQAYWIGLYTQAASSGTAAAAQDKVVAGFLDSREYRQVLVTGAYYDLLHRAPEASGLAYWSDQLAAGMDVKGLFAQIAGSSEYFAAQGGSATGFVDALYRDLLGRAPEPQGLSYWTKYGTADQHARFENALAFMYSPEGRHILLNGNYGGPPGSVGAPGTPAVGDYALADISGNGWGNLYFQGNLSTSAVDSLFAKLAYTPTDEVIAEMLDMQEYFRGSA
ncbi:MAG TPA: DUF4214 domain-containing protein, partial [Pirellulales bacterium]|nr:DUF4214 domain-containing protein [Pirellulales bacterium]